MAYIEVTVVLKAITTTKIIEAVLPVIASTEISRTINNVLF
jgi:hypothetical protein